MLILMVILLLFGSTAQAEVQWDQRNDPPYYYGWSSLSFVPLQGQEFVPDFDLINILHFWIEDHDGEEIGQAEFSVRLREETIFGPLVATSWALALPEGFQGIAPFLFDDVALTPGEKYVFEIVIDPTGSPGNWGVVYTASQPPSEDYERGNRVRDGVVAAVQDLWFREGVYQNVSVDQSTWGSIKALYR